MGSTHAWLGLALAACQAAAPPPAPASAAAPSPAPVSTPAPSAPAPPPTPETSVAASASASASISIANEKVSVESNGEGSASIVLRGTKVKCDAVHAAHAALTSCTLEGSAGKAFVGHGLSDGPGELVCTRGSAEYQWEHGGGWNSGPAPLMPGAGGARVVLAPGVEVWLAPDLTAVELAGTRSSARLEITLDDVPASVKVSEHDSTPASHAQAPVILDLSKPASTPGDACQPPGG